MEDLIRNLDDAIAIRILKTIARQRLRAGAEEIEYSGQLGQALRGKFGLPGAPPRASEGDVAREALVVLAAADPPTGQAIATMVKNPPPISFDAGLTIAIATAAIIVLQTEFSIERDKDGRWSLSFKKKPTSEKLVEKLLGLFAG